VKHRAIGGPAGGPRYRCQTDRCADAIRVPLAGNLADFRKLGVGDYRAVYQVRDRTVVVHALAVGPRRDKEIYLAASKRKS